MAFLKFNKAELVNLSYSLKREIIAANKAGAYCNTSIVGCNTRRYHGLLAVPVDRYQGIKYMLLSSLDESLILKGKQFNLGIHCYGDIYDPRGHKYVVDFSADPVDQITFKVGEIIFRKSFVLNPTQEQTLIKYELLQAPSAVTLRLKPFLAFRDVHALTSENDAANTDFKEIDNGVVFNMYPGFPDLNLQLSSCVSSFKSQPYWYKGITYSDEYRRGYDCKEDLFVPGYFETVLKPGESIVFSASVVPAEPAKLKRKFTDSAKKLQSIETGRDQLLHWADLFKQCRNGRKQISAGFSWLYTGLLRETLMALPGLTLYANGDKREFEEILDNLIADEQDRLFRRTTQIEAPLYMTVVLQKYIDFGADEKKVWQKYGSVIKGILESYLSANRKEISMQPDGLLWAQMDSVALSWMNAYINRRPVTERVGYQVETNAFWYNSVCFALEMETKYGSEDSYFIQKWTPIKDLIRKNFTEVFWNPRIGCLSDFVSGGGQNYRVRPNQLFAVCLKYSPLDEEYIIPVYSVIRNELLTSRGIRTLSPRDNDYRGVYDGPQIERDMAYHGGSTRIWLLAPFVELSFLMKGPAFCKKAEWLTEGFYEDLSKHGVGAFSELYDGDPPHEPHGAVSSALSTAALLEINYLLDKYKEEGK